MALKAGGGPWRYRADWRSSGLARYPGSGLPNASFSKRESRSWFGCFVVNCSRHLGQQRHFGRINNSGKGMSTFAEPLRAAGVLPPQKMLRAVRGEDRGVSAVLRSRSRFRQFDLRSTAKSQGAEMPDMDGVREQNVMLQPWRDEIEWEPVCWRVDRSADACGSSPAQMGLRERSHMVLWIGPAASQGISDGGSRTVWREERPT
jgi:hypothetical protein